MHNTMRQHSIALGIALVSFIVYARTLAPSITWRNAGADSGDLVAAAFTGGVPHPPGYPLYLLIASLFARLPVSEPALGVGLFSALSASLAVMMVFYAARAFNVTDASAAIAALVFAFSPLLWSQATIAEVSALNTFFVAALFAIMFSNTRHKIELAAFVFGLALTHHLTIVLLAPTIALMLRDAEWTRTRIVRASALCLAPLSLYAILPMRAVNQPPINWGNAATLEGFVWLVSAAAYRPYVFNLAPTMLSERLAFAVRLLFEQFNVWGVALGLWGIVQMSSGRQQSIALIIGLALTSAYALIYASRDSYIYLLPAFLIFALWIAYGISDLLKRLPVRAIVLAALVLLPGFNLLTNFPAMDLSQDREAFHYAQTALTTVPTNTVLLADGDEHLFALWYYRYVIAPESRSTIVSVELLQFDWYYEQMRAQMPGLPSAARTTDRLHAIITQATAQQRAVYATAPLNALSAYILTPQRNLYLVERAR